MYINRRPAFPTYSDYDVKASGSLGYGLIKTISQTNTYYCIDEDCEYRVTLYVDNLNYLYFFPTIFPNNSDLHFNNFLYLIEELENNEVVTYELNVPKIEGNWVFTLIPTEGSANLYINPDVKPDKLANYKYQAKAHRTEEIIITHTESEKFGFSYTKFYVTYKSSIPGKTSTFKF